MSLRRPEPAVAGGATSGRHIYRTASDDRVEVAFSVDEPPALDSPYARATSSNGPGETTYPNPQEEQGAWLGRGHRDRLTGGDGVVEGAFAGM
jgi:hypothetical protein